MKTLLALSLVLTALTLTAGCNKSEEATNDAATPAASGGSATPGAAKPDRPAKSGAAAPGLKADS